MNAVPGHRLSTKVGFHISCAGLPKLDLMSQTDPFAVLYVKKPDGGFQELDRTETIKDTVEPKFTKHFILDYHFEEIQTLKISVFDRDDKSEKLKKHDAIGESTFTLGNLMGCPGQVLTLPLVSKSRKGSHGESKVIITAEEVAHCNDVLVVKFAAKKLDNKDGLFGKSDPFLAISRGRENGQWIRVWQNKHIDNDLNPKWKEAEISIQSLCNGDLHRPLLVECWDHDDDGRHDLIGSTQLTVNNLITNPGAELPLRNEQRAKKKGKKYTNSGVLFATSARVVKRHSFLDYLRGGCNISLMVAIDYTASNGAPSTPQSLHYRNPTGAPNEYQAAIQAVGSILQDYDSDRRFPVYGFGGQLNGATSHCFPLTFDPTHPEVAGVSGILQAYANSFNFVSLSGPTLFAPVLSAASSIASQHVTQQSQSYYVLLILTDGCIQDMQQTVDTIVAASNLPLSGVIVGVGSANFAAMKALDADEHRLRASSGQVAARDIVQFVEFRKYGPHAVSRLAQDTLAEIPFQLVEFMKARKIVPNAPPPPMPMQPYAYGAPGQPAPQPGHPQQQYPPAQQHQPQQYSPPQQPHQQQYSPPLQPQGQQYAPPQQSQGQQYSPPLQSQGQQYPPQQYQYPPQQQQQPPQQQYPQQYPPPGQQPTTGAPQQQAYQPYPPAPQQPQYQQQYPPPQQQYSSQQAPYYPPPPPGQGGPAAQQPPHMAQNTNNYASQHAASAPSAPSAPPSAAPGQPPPQQYQGQYP